MKHDLLFSNIEEVKDDSYIIATYYMELEHGKSILDAANKNGNRPNIRHMGFCSGHYGGNEKKSYRKNCWHLQCTAL